MCYRCEICGVTAPHGQSKLRHVVYKDKLGRTLPSDATRFGNDIARELSVCSDCHKRLVNWGTPLGVLLCHRDKLVAR